MTTQGDKKDNNSRQRPLSKAEIREIVRVVVREEIDYAFKPIMTPLARKIQELVGRIENVNELLTDTRLKSAEASTSLAATVKGAEEKANTAVTIAENTKKDTALMKSELTSTVVQQIKDAETRIEARIDTLSADISKVSDKLADSRESHSSVSGKFAVIAAIVLAAISGLIGYALK